jgi:Cu/Ag efflux pump CusA
MAPGHDYGQADRDMDKAVQMPGVPAWTMPIKARIDMLATGIHAHRDQGIRQEPARSRRWPRRSKQS